MLEKITIDLKEAMKSQDKFKLSVLRMLKSALQAEQINQKHELNDDEIIAVIKKQVKVRNASKEEYIEYNRQDLADNLAKEIEILSVYLPEELPEEEIDKIIDSVFAKVNPTSMKDMGTIMKEVTPLLANRADMSVVSKKIREKLNN